MHYYQFNIGDYASHTRYLTQTEDLGYRRLLDLYYLSEKPLPVDAAKVARLVGMSECFGEIEAVLLEFFTLADDGWVNRDRNTVVFSYPRFNMNPKVGDVIALGNHTEWRYVVVTGINTKCLSGLTRYSFKEVE